MRIFLSTHLDTAEILAASKFSSHSVPQAKLTARFKKKQNMIEQDKRRPWQRKERRCSKLFYLKREVVRR